MNNLLLGTLISISFWMTPAPTYARGGAVWYAPGVMEATCAVRGLSLDGYVDGVALMSPADLGKSVWINGPNGWEGPFLVCDCGIRGQVWEMVTVRGELIEVGWKTAVRWGMGPHEGGWKTTVDVLVDPVTPPRGQPVDYVDWFNRNAVLETCKVWVTDHDWAYCP